MYKNLILPDDLYNKPVAVPAAMVFTSSSTPLTQENITPNPLYITAKINNFKL